mmetsp:Transcript_56530/g.157545  ORF Transcript_56530/g.157545 Transcript_56530/m.157545 type:complete len:227 (+) Transcript_56530:1204-1884(+)
MRSRSAARMKAARAQMARRLCERRRPRCSPRVAAARASPTRWPRQLLPRTWCQWRPSAARGFSCEATLKAREVCPSPWTRTSSSAAGLLVLQSPHPAMLSIFPTASSRWRTTAPTVPTIRGLTRYEASLPSAASTVSQRVPMRWPRCTATTCPNFPTGSSTSPRSRATRHQRRGASRLSGARLGRTRRRKPPPKGCVGSPRVTMATGCLPCRRWAKPHQPRRQRRR